MGFRMSGQGLYKPPKHRDLAAVVTFESVSGARKAASKLKKMFRSALRQGRLKRALTIKKATQYAANRALATARNHPSLKPKTRARLRKIAKIYDSAEEWMKKQYEKAKENKASKKRRKAKRKRRRKR